MLPSHDDEDTIDEFKGSSQTQVYFCCLVSLSLSLSPGAGRMSVSMAKADGVTVFTLTSDPNNPWPPLCQILKGLCYSPMCCTVSQQLKKVQRTSQSVLGVSDNRKCFEIAVLHF